MKISLSGAQVVIDDFDPTGTINLDSLALSEHQLFTIAGTSSVTINGGAGIDTVEFLAADYELSGVSLTVNAETIKVDDGTTLNLGSGDLTLNADLSDDGFSLLGITTTGLPDDATIDIDNATITAHNVNLTANSHTLATSVNGASQDLSGGTLTVASTAGFDTGGGKFTVVVSGSPVTCTYGGISGSQFTTVSGCSGTPDDKAAVKKDIDETGAAHGVQYAGVQLIYDAKVDIHGGTTITAGGNVTISSTVDVTATASAAGELQEWSATSYAKDDAVLKDGKQYTANAATSSGDVPGSSSKWDLVSAKDASIAAAVVVASALSRLTDTASIAAASGTVGISSSMTTNVTTKADSSASKSGAGIAVGIVVTDSEAYVNSTSANPVHATGLTVQADTNDSAPTTGKASPGGTDSSSDANSPTSADSKVGVDTSAAGSKASGADGQSKTSDGSQGFAAALAVTVLDATTNAYIDPNGDTSADHTIDVGTGTIKVHAGATVSGSATADAGNVNFSPGAPTLTATAGGTLTDGTTYYYRVSALYAGDGSATTSGTNDLSTGTLTLNSASAFDPSGGVVEIGTTFCHYGGKSGNQLTGIAGCTGTPSSGTTVTGLDESAPSAEASKAADSSHKSVGLSWTAMPTATRVRRLPEHLERRRDAPPVPHRHERERRRQQDADRREGLDRHGQEVRRRHRGRCERRRPDDERVHRRPARPDRGQHDGGNDRAEPVHDGGARHLGRGRLERRRRRLDRRQRRLREHDLGRRGDDHSVALNGDLALTAAANLVSSATADAVQDASKNTVGIGASFGLDVVNDTVTAGIPSAAQITGAKNLTITSDDTDSASTEADGGAGAGSSGLALSAQVAITISNVTTSASVADGSDLTLTGDADGARDADGVDEDDREGLDEGRQRRHRPLARARQREPLGLLAAPAQPHRRRRRELRGRRLLLERHRGDRELGRVAGQEGRRRRLDRQHEQGRQQEGRRQPDQRVRLRLERQDHRQDDAERDRAARAAARAAARRSPSPPPPRSRSCRRRPRRRWPTG